MNDPIQPTPTPDTLGFWNATARGELALCACATCDRFFHPPLERCPACGEPTAFTPVSGQGSLHSYIVVHRAVVPGYPPGHLVGLVDLVEQPGLRLAARLVDVSAESIRIGMPLRARIVDLPGGSYRVPVFGPPDPTTGP
jgi:uncharacterized OB-fold protein